MLVFWLFGGFGAASTLERVRTGWEDFCFCFCVRVCVLLDVDCGLRAVGYVFSFWDQRVGHGSNKNTHVRVDVYRGGRPVERLGW